MDDIRQEPVFDPATGRYRLQTDWHAFEEPGILIIEAVATVLNRDELDLRPLQEVVDLDGLESLLHAPVTSQLSVEFEYEDTIVELSRTGKLCIEVL